MSIPVELSISGIYLPPLLVAAMLGMIATILVTKLLNEYRWSRHFFYPPLAFVSIFVIFTVLVNYTVIPF